MKNNRTIIIGVTIGLGILGFLGIQVFDITIFGERNLKISTERELEMQTSSQINTEKELEPQILSQVNVEKEMNQETSSQQIGVEKIPLSKLMEILKDLPSSSSKFEFIEHNIEFIQGDLSLGGLNRLLDLFSRSDDKLRIIKTFLSRLEDGYPDDEFRRFKKQFPSSSDKIKAINLLLRNKKGQISTDN